MHKAVALSRKTRFLPQEDRETTDIGPQMSEFS
jgi:hypothetical protein